MSTTTKSQPTIAFFGATGGVALTVLAHALLSQGNCIALARTPSKLTTALLALKIPQSTLDQHLTIVAGNALSASDVTTTLTAGQPSHLVTHIVSGLGASPVLQWPSLWNPFSFVTIDDPTLCGTAAATLVSALQSIYNKNQNSTVSRRRPSLTFVSTTGITSDPSFPADVPFLMRFLYHHILAVPHQDKRVMEQTFFAAADENVFGGVVAVRPTLLTGVASVEEVRKGDLKVRAGTEREPATGYTISRAQVGLWVWVHCLESAEERKRWDGERVSLTA